jgi:hypothetical protein
MADTVKGTHAASEPLTATTLTATTGLVLPKTSGTGIKVDTSTPVFGWRDLIGDVHNRGIGATDPAYNVYIGGIRQFQFTVNDEVFNEFHWAHDYVPGTSCFIHTHWSHNATTVTGGSVTWGFEFSWAKGYDQAAFSAPKTITVQQNASTVRYRHMIAEVEFTSNGGNATHLDYNLLEIDGILMVRTYLSANNMTVSGGGVPEPFLHFVDIHYQSTGMPTFNKNYPFYSV